MTTNPQDKPKPPTPAAPKKPSGWDVAKNFIRGGLAGMFATCCIQPLDITKVRIQLRSELKGKGGNISLNPFSVIKEIYSQGGVTKFYIGLDSALCRQATYTTTRMGCYQSFFNYLKA